VGAPFAWRGVDIGNVTNIRVVQDKSKTAHPGRSVMKVNTRYRFNLREIH